MKTNDLVAVYGSLRRGLSNHRILGDSEFIGEGMIDSGFRMVSLGGFPALHKSEESTPIKVEIYRPSCPEVYRSLDILEGYPSFYNREQVQINGKLTWVYFIENSSRLEGRTYVDSGDWVGFRQQQHRGIL